jgi:hypothetical protein
MQVLCHRNNRLQSKTIILIFLSYEFEVQNAFLLDEILTNLVAALKANQESLMRTRYYERSSGFIKCLI